MLKTEPDASVIVFALSASSPSLQKITFPLRGGQENKDYPKKVSDVEVCKNGLFRFGRPLLPPHLKPLMIQITIIMARLETVLEQENCRTDENRNVDNPFVFAGFP